MKRFYEYALTEVEGETDKLLTAGWTQDYAAVRSLRRKFDREGKKSFMVVQEVTTEISRNGHVEPRYDVDALVDEVHPVLVSLGLLDESSFEDPNDMLDEAERLTLALMPLFAESIAQSIVKTVVDMYTLDDDEKNETLKKSYEEKKDKMFDEASQVRNIGGVPSWSHNAGTGYTV